MKDLKELKRGLRQSANFRRGISGQYGVLVDHHKGKPRLTTRIDNYQLPVVLTLGWPQNYKAPLRNTIWKSKVGLVIIFSLIDLKSVLVTVVFGLYFIDISLPKSTKYITWKLLYSNRQVTSNITNFHFNWLRTRSFYTIMQ